MIVSWNITSVSGISCKGLVTFVLEYFDDCHALNVMKNMSDSKATIKIISITLWLIQPPPDTKLLHCQTYYGLIMALQKIFQIDKVHLGYFIVWLEVSCQWSHKKLFCNLKNSICIKDARQRGRTSIIMMTNPMHDKFIVHKGPKCT